MRIEIDKTPFSRAGSYYTIARLPVASPRRKPDGIPPGLYIRTVHGDAAVREIFLIEPWSGQAEQYTVEATPSVLTVRAQAGSLLACFARESQIRLRASGVGLRLSLPKNTRCAGVIPQGENRVLFNLCDARENCVLTALCGQMQVDSRWDGKTLIESAEVLLQPDASGRCELALEFFHKSVKLTDAFDPFDACAAQVAAEFEAFLSTAPETPSAYESGRIAAAYQNWSSIVAAQREMPRRGMLMSKNWMINVWSWDHCFNAIAHSFGRDVSVGFDQLMVLFDKQDENGALPDSVSDVHVIWNFCKPPIHGWAFSKMRRINSGYALEHAGQLYPKLARWTDWWFTARDPERTGLPRYEHGNDSGWDNSTMFSDQPPLETPDLITFLILQTEELAELAGLLGLSEEAERWKRRAAMLLEQLMDRFWLNDRFIARNRAGQVIDTDTLVFFIPLLLGKRLGARKAALMADRLVSRGFFTPYGLATERPESQYYVPDGYWRGPIWAPSTLLIVEGLRACGYAELAGKIAKAFVDAVDAVGFYENYDALTGEGLCDPGYTWTSSVYLLLLGEYGGAF